VRGAGSGGGGWVCGGASAAGLTSDDWEGSVAVVSPRAYAGTACTLVDGVY
jgi:hypothetical protein